MRMKLYAIRHRETGEWFKTPAGKSLWKRSGDAKNGWAMAQVGPGSPFPPPTFDTDGAVEWEVVEMAVLPLADFMQMEDKAEFYELLVKAGVEELEVYATASAMVFEEKL